jgi:predicted aspartyl protease
MKFTYTAKWVDDYGISYTPRVPVVFSNPKTKSELPIMSLVDSGASDILLDPQIGELLGIDVPSGEKMVYAAVGSEVVGYIHTLTIRVAGDRHTHEVPCAFTEIGGDVRAVLGQRGFFEHYKIVFERYKNQFEIVAKRSARRS